jgi:hypothetical protein
MGGRAHWRGDKRPEPIIRGQESSAISCAVGSFVPPVQLLQSPTLLPPSDPACSSPSASSNSQTLLHLLLPDPPSPPLAESVLSRSLSAGSNVSREALVCLLMAFRTCTATCVGMVGHQTIVVLSYLHNDFSQAS